jgi:hypothetical protein
MQTATIRRSLLRRTKRQPIRWSSPSASRPEAFHTAGISAQTRRSNDCRARCYIQLGAGVAYTLGTPTPQVGAIYSGLVVGVTSGGKVIKPLTERWPDATGAFSMRLPASVRGKTVRFWENQRQFFSHFAARPGGAVDLAAWPSQLGNAVPAGLATLAIPRK